MNTGLHTRDSRQPSTPEGIDQNSWDALVRKVRERDCVAIIGGGLRSPPLAGILPADLARRLAEGEYPSVEPWDSLPPSRYPLRVPEGCFDLAQVAQYLRSVVDTKHVSDMFIAHEMVKDIFAEQLDALDARDEHWAENGHPLVSLAKLRLPVYITTAYDDLLERAFQLLTIEPTVQVCRWSNERSGDVRDDPEDIEGTEDHPLIFHLHGIYSEPASMVLNEVDHMSFNTQLINDVEEDRRRLTPTVRNALSTKRQLFVGFPQLDRNFRGLLYDLGQISDNRNRAVAIQIERSAAAATDRDEAHAFLQSYFHTLRGGHEVTLCSGDAEGFLDALAEEVRDDRS